MLPRCSPSVLAITASIEEKLTNNGIINLVLSSGCGILRSAFSLECSTKSTYIKFILLLISMIPVLMHFTCESVYCLA